jgi:hypothetical protein
MTGRATQDRWGATCGAAITHAMDDRRQVFNLPVPAPLQCGHCGAHGRRSGATRRSARPRIRIGNWSSRSQTARNMQLEAKAHIVVQRWTDTGRVLRPQTASPQSTGAFAGKCPRICCGSKTPATQEKIKVVPGGLRHRDVQVGRHVPVSAPARHGGGASPPCVDSPVA